ncbi:class I adenylate-forming enzyme family protein [Nocardia carnea]|uniref:Class I adenylate-forming enzyme family protein n=1 Tax=Nocardia carnea TaxID=37328 RepID=A0ABW7THJ3_9NOCA|nr:class I adenylate-forming enzyme family protein [Nocardia carnea]
MPEPTEATDTIDTLLRRQAAERGDHPAVIDPHTRTTYADLDTTTRRLAAAFVEAGITKGTRVGLIAPNSVGWVRIALALTRIGAVLVPMSTLLKPPELIAQLRVAGVAVLITTEEFRGHRYLDGLRSELGGSIDTAPIHEPGLPALRRIFSVEAATALVAVPEAARLAGPSTGTDPGLTPDTQPARAPTGTPLIATPAATAVAEALAATVRPADPMLIMFTSGSRGLPKGVIHSHGNALAAVRSGLDARCIDAETRLYLPMPFFWVGGFGGGFLSALAAGATLVTEEIPRPETTLELLEHERVTLFRGWPDQAEALARRVETLGTDLSALHPGSLEALLPPAQRSRPGARANLFGMTESFGPYCGYPADTDMPESAHGSCGRPFDGMEVRITDSAGDSVPAGTIGEIQLRGPHILRGICGRAREDLFTADGYYPTGDLGRLDEAGFLFYHGRRDDMFKVNGATVYPGEVEKALRSLANVSSAFVTDIDRGDGDRVAAAVIVTGCPSIDGLRAATKKILSSFKVPTTWLLLDSDADIPRGTTGKVDIAALRKLLTDRGIDATIGPPR